jgi:hypothetical protein
VIAAVELRATIDCPEHKRLEMLRVLTEALDAWNRETNEATIDGWTITVESAIEARCVYERAMLWEQDARPRNERCPETATEVVGGSPYCGSHAKGAHRLMDALGRAS